MIELESRYNAKEVEDRIYKYWLDNNSFCAKAFSDKKPFCIVMPPPNVTGILHMGHALNNTYQDILIRFKRMRGFESLWMPGTDHAGIATQNVVEKKLAREGKKRQDLGREAFLKEVWQWKEQYGSTIIRQLKKLGSSCDWSRERFTMDEKYSESVKEVFIHLYKKGLIYRGNYIINWCPRCQTALSDEEAAHHDLEGNLYYIKYPLKKSNDQRSTTNNYIIVATTRPETMLGDTAVAVNPKDKRYKDLIGQTLILPLVEREIKIIADDHVDPKFGTGAVKVTPAHDPNDYEIGMRHKLAFINIMHPDATLNSNAGDYAGLDRFEARENIIEDLNERKLLEKIEPHKHAVGHCYRCNTIVEPYLSWQWFVKMAPLAKPAIETVRKAEIKFYPKRWSKVYLNWMENIRDWCISRQIWWGHRLPVYYCRICFKPADVEAKGIIVAKIKPEKCPTCGSADIYQDEDVLDTWFSSWLWPFATFYWPVTNDQNKRDLDYFYPTSVLVTAPEIIFFWVARMIMAGFEFMGKKPFSDVYIHGTVRDIEGKKMSKSLGNIIDPLDIINKYGTDALRFSLMSLTSIGQDVFLSEQKFELGRNFANKLWNASRFSLMNLDLSCADTDLCVFFKKTGLDMPERWILSRFYSMLNSLNKSLDNYRFNEAANLLYEFIWHEFCDWYIEMAKPSLLQAPSSKLSHHFANQIGRDPAYYLNDEAEQAQNTQIVLYKVLEKTLRCLHPFMPFITEEIWQKLKPQSSIMRQNWPHVQKDLIDKKLEENMRLVMGVITAIRTIKSELRIAEGARGKVILVSDAKTAKILKVTRGHIISLAKLEDIELATQAPITKGALNSVVENVQVILQLEGLVDINAELQKINKEIEKLSQNISAKETRLKNKEFLKKAPEDIVEKERISIEETKETLKKLKKIKDELQK